MASDSDSDCLPLDLGVNERRHAAAPIRFSFWNTVKHHIPRFLVTILVDLILPFVIYLALQKRTKPVHALISAGIPPLIMVVVKAVVARTFDALGFLVFFGFSASAIVAIITRNPIVLLLEKSLVNGLLSVVFAVTLIPFRCCHYRCHIRPLAYYFYQDFVPTKRADVGLPDVLFENEREPMDESDLLENSVLATLTPKQEVSQVYEWIYAHCSPFRRSCYLITSIWAVGLLLEFLARVALIVLRLSVEQIFIYGHVILSVMTSILIALSILCITKERKQTLQSIEKWKRDYLVIGDDRTDRAAHVGVA